MDLFDEIVTIAGKPGLFRIVKPTRTGYVAEELNGSKKRLVINQNHRVSFLKEISIFTLDSEGSTPIRGLYEKLDSKPEEEISSQEGLDVLESILPNYDPDRVYKSDAKKLISWYFLLKKECPEIDFSGPKEESEEKAKESIE